MVSISALDLVGVFPFWFIISFFFFLLQFAAIILAFIFADSTDLFLIFTFT